MEVYVKTPSEKCRENDKNGLYKKAEKGEIRYLPGVDIPFEEPESPWLMVSTKNTLRTAIDDIANSLISEKNIYKKKGGTPMTFKNNIRKFVNLFGIDIIRRQKSPEQTLLGLAHSDFGSIIDVGANIGQFARMITGFFPASELYCFEPLDGPFQELSTWAATQNGRVNCFQLALGESEGKAKMHLHEIHAPSSSLLSTTDSCHNIYPQTKPQHLTPVKLSTLDSMLAAKLDSIPKDILLKLDVQGFEDRVLRGASQVLTACRAVLLEICIEPLYEGQADFYELTQLLYEVGFHYAGNMGQVYGKNGKVIFLDAVFLKN